MSTKIKSMSVSPFDGLGVTENGVVILNNTEPITTETPKKTSSKKKAAAKPAPVETSNQETPQVETKSLEEIANEISAKEAALAAKEAELNEKQARLQKAAEILQQAEELAAKKHEEANNKENKIMANNTQTPASKPLSEMTLEEVLAAQKAAFDGNSVKVETEDYWTTAKKGFIAGAATAGGVLTVVGLVKLGCYLLGGGSDN